MAFLLDFFAAGAELIARTGGFLPLAAGLALMLFLSASIKSITGARCGCDRGSHFLALLFRGDHRPHAFLVLVAIFCRLKRRRQAVDQLHRKLLFLFLRLHFIRWLNSLHFADFTLIKHGVQRHALGARANHHDVLALVHGHLGDRP